MGLYIPYRLPLFYGLMIGYVTGVALSVAVDLVWLPIKGYSTHGW